MNKERRRLYVKSRKEWRNWLEKNHDDVSEIWVEYYKKHTGKSRIPYDDAVEEAICFGWIDSTVKRIDDEKYMQKFTPRKEKSKWSALNRQRAEKMIKERRMTDAGLSKIKEAKKRGTWKSKDYDIDVAKPPSDLIKALKANKTAYDNFKKFSPTIKKMYIGWIVSAKRNETRKKRITEAVKLAKKNIKSFM
jgi:uncharacterized protein YdeI (YjbR/CyaY-like superfamily)